jgi:nicotinamide phosphoribosyltransferase
MTARGSRIPESDKVVVFGLQYFVYEYLVKRFQRDFFDQPKADVIGKYKRRLDNALGFGAVSMEHMEALHDLGYLPIHIKALPEGSRCPMRIPFVTITETKPEFFWLVNFLETLMSNVIWHPITTATIAHEYRVLLNAAARKSSDAPEFVEWQGHDFSMRGHTSLESSCVSGMAHLTSFYGTDTIPAIDFLEEYYDANSDKENIGNSVYATEHSVMCMGGEATELETFRRLITEVYPKSIISIVSDTWDYFSILTKTLPALKNEIMARDGKVVIRPDSGDPVKIVCGDPDALVDSPESKGTIQLLWDTFGGKVNSKGYRELDPHIGAIYGDSITYDRAKQITDQLMAKGFASTNIVFGIGSYTYQYVTRDTFGFAIKATSGVINGTRVSIAKNPKTDNGLKKSAKGLLRVDQVRGAHGVTGFTLTEDVTPGEEMEGALEVIYSNGGLGHKHTLSEIRARLARG